MSSNNDKKMKISFDWDNTISMSYLDEESPETKFIHQGYNQEFIDEMLNYIKEGHEVWIVTSRVRDLEDELRSIIIDTRGFKGWNELQAIRQQVMKEEREGRYRALQRQNKIKSILGAVLGVFIIGAGGAGLVWFAMEFRD